MVKQHIPILVQEILEHIPEHARCIVDGTFGHGGHTKSFIQHVHSRSDPVFLYCFDRDYQVMERGKLLVKESFPSLPSNLQMHYINQSYATMAEELNDMRADFVLLDLGINWEHVTDNARGFSFQGDGPLDMRFDPTSGMSALELIQSSSLEDIAQRFVQYGDYHETRARQIAQVLVTHRGDPILSTTL